MREIWWDDGTGPVPAAQRVKALVDAIPQILLKQVQSNDLPLPRLVRATKAAWAVVVSQRPDILIVRVRKKSRDPYAYPVQDWVNGPDVPYLRQIDQHIERFNYIVPGIQILLVPERLTCGLRNSTLFRPVPR